MGPSLKIRPLDLRDPPVISAAFDAIAGIGVGMYPDYGAAQRLYVLRGYVPDGRGLTYRRHVLEPMGRPGTTMTWRCTSPNASSEPLAANATT